MQRVEGAPPPPRIERRRRAGSRRLWRERRAARPLAPPYVRLHLAAVFTAQFFDLGTFGRMVSHHGIKAELNPIIARGFDTFGLPVIVLTKLALIVLVCAIVVMLAAEHPRRRPSPGLASLVTVIAVAAGLVGGVSNLLGSVTYVR